MLNEVTVRHPSWRGLSAEGRQVVVAEFGLGEAYLVPSRIPSVTFFKGQSCVLCAGALYEEIVGGKEGKLLILKLDTDGGKALVEVQNPRREGWSTDADAFEKNQFFWYMTLDKRHCPSGARVMLPTDSIREALTVYPALRQNAERALLDRKKEEELRRRMLTPPRPEGDAVE